MLTACATSRAARPAPIVEQTTVTRTLCPIELRLSPPAKPAPAAAAVVQGNQAGLAFVAALAGWGDDMAARLADAAQACERQP